VSVPPAAAPDGRAGDGAWLELAVTCDPEAVEAVSEILARVAPGGVSVEPGFTLVDEGLGAAVDPRNRWLLYRGRHVVDEVEDETVEGAFA